MSLTPEQRVAMIEEAVLAGARQAVEHTIEENRRRAASAQMDSIRRELDRLSQARTQAMISAQSAAEYATRSATNAIDMLSKAADFYDYSDEMGECKFEPERERPEPKPTLIDVWRD